MELRNFIKTVRLQINDKNFEFCYRVASYSLEKEDLGKFTKLLYDCQIDPLLYLEEIPRNFLYGRTDIFKIKIPENIKAISYDAFCGCSNLKEVIIPTSVTLIEDYAFNGGKSLKTLTYLGTIGQWGAIHKSGWFFGSAIETVQCSDGIID